jgi:sulfopropanediol 3-dehydrogenase
MEYIKRAGPTRPEDTQKIRDVVSQIILDIEKNGISAVIKYSEKFDEWNPSSFRVSDNEIQQAKKTIDPELARDIDFAREQVEKFATLQKETLREFSTQTLPGITLGQKQIPINSVGSYVPGGRYPLIASAIMTIAVPRVAGVRRIVATAPPQRGVGAINPVQLYAMATAGAHEILSLGGVQALAALAFGIEDIPPVSGVDMIVGAGNAYVAEAKRQLFGKVGIDLLAGPTEILVIADDMADPRLLAADLLGQAEHGPNSPAILITDSKRLALAVSKEIDKWLATWPTAKTAGEAWNSLGQIIVEQDRNEVLRLADEIASEHVEVHAQDWKWFLDNLTNYGSLFIGPNATVAYGDKGIGTNHVLPTGKAAKYTGGLWVGKFLKTVTWQQVSDEGNRKIAPIIASVAAAEGMEGHAITARIRVSAVEVRSVE